MGVMVVMVVTMVMVMVVVVMVVVHHSAQMTTSSIATTTDHLATQNCKYRNRCLTTLYQININTQYYYSVYPFVLVSC